MTPFSATAPDENVVNFVTKYREKYGATPDQFAADSYDAIYTLYEAAKVAASTSDMTADECCDKLIEAMKTLTINGVTGTMTWSETGEGVTQGAEGPFRSRTACTSIS